MSSTQSDRFVGAGSRMIGCVVLAVWAAACAHASEGTIAATGGDPLFPIGFYELPGDDAELKRMADAGINLIRCGSRADLDRAGAVGMMGWVPLGVHSGPTDGLRDRINSLKDHPALALWEGPDEIIWHKTAMLAANGKDGMEGQDWWRQTPKAVAHARAETGQVIPNMRAGVTLLKELDASDRPFWMNEALYTDVGYMRQCLDFADIIGCDYYPVGPGEGCLPGMGEAVQRWRGIGRDMPVWMVLQAFAWSELDANSTADPVYPTFAESRFMAYDVIVHGADAILYWGSHYLKSAACREAIYAVTSELAALQPFLVAKEEKGVQVALVEMGGGEGKKGVRHSARRAGDDWLIILVNEDDDKHMGVEVSGLEGLEDDELALLRKMTDRFGITEKHFPRIFNKQSYTDEQIAEIFQDLKKKDLHYSFILDLIAMALADGVILDPERMMLVQIVELIGIDRVEFHNLINFAQATSSL
ncbi:MAG: hypothetical protein GY851_14765, partial [bacterium]|nr:hypothetical protein [bacterium]